MDRLVIDAAPSGNFKQLGAPIGINLDQFRAHREVLEVEGTWEDRLDAVPNGLGYRMGVVAQDVISSPGALDLDMECGQLLIAIPPCITRLMDAKAARE